MSEKLSEIMSRFVDTGLYGVTVAIEEVSDWEELHKVRFFDRIAIHEEVLGRKLTLDDLRTAKKKITKSVSPHLNPDLSIKVDWVDDVDFWGEDEELFEVTLYLEERHEDMTVDEVLDDVWSFIVACVSLTDKGTFGWEYLFDE